MGTRARVKKKAKEESVERAFKKHVLACVETRARVFDGACMCDSAVCQALESDGVLSAHHNHDCSATYFRGAARPHFCVCVFSNHSRFCWGKETAARESAQSEANSRAVAYTDDDSRARVS